MTDYGPPTPSYPPMPPVKVCPKCSVQSMTDGQFCPQCGASYVAKQRRFRLSTPLITVIVVLFAAIGVAVFALVKHSNDQDAARVASASRSSVSAASVASSISASVDASRSAVIAASQSAAAERRKAELLVRHLLIKEMQGDITKDARKDVNDGILDGPIIGTSCDPVAGGSTEDLTAKTTAFSCLAVTDVAGDGTEHGYSFSALMNWDKSSWSWHLGN